MRIHSDDFYDQLEIEDLQFEYRRIAEPFHEKSTVANLRGHLKYLHRQRFLSCWHDTSTVSNASHILVLFTILYDPALFYTDTEFFELTGKDKTNLVSFSLSMKNEEKKLKKKTKHLCLFYIPYSHIPFLKNQTNLPLEILFEKLKLNKVSK